MRLSSLAPALAGSLLLGWAAAAQAAAPPPPAPPASPPAEPIFYCPVAPGHAGAPHPGGHTGRHAGHRQSCPRPEARNDRPHHNRGKDERLAAAGGHRGARDDVSASQAFIYNYERLHGGFDPRAARAAWAAAGHDHRGPPPGDDSWHGDDTDMADADYDHDHAGGHGDDMADSGRDHDHHHARGHDHDDMADAGADHDHDHDHNGDGDHAGPPMGPPDHGRWADARSSGHYGHLYERSERSSSSSSSSSHWSTADGGSWTYSSTGGWTHHGGHGGDGVWRDGSYGAVVEYAGRDAHGYLIWPGKTAQPDPDADRDHDHH